LDWQRHSTWLPILELATAKFLAADFKIGSSIVWLPIYESTVA
jgi:hypothetical protein